ncbi:MAG: AtpZ/AtpI family protein [Patescibacteria group bacterium]
MGKYDLIINHKGIKKVERLEKGQKIAKRVNWRNLALFGNIGIAIVLPLVGGLIGGKYLDGIWGTYPKATLTLFIFGFIVSIVNIVRTFQDFLRESKLF